MDLHANQIQGFFNIPVDHLQGASLLANHMREKIGGNNDDYIVVSPDLGSVTRSRNFASKNRHRSCYYRQEKTKG